MNSSGKLVIIIVVEKGRHQVPDVIHRCKSFSQALFAAEMQLQTKPILTHLVQRCFMQHLSDKLGSQDEYIT
jgi:hypothetical protein